MPTVNSSVVFKFGTRAQYDAATKDDNTIYMITDEKKIFVGSDQYCLPGTFNDRKNYYLYINGYLVGKSSVSISEVVLGSEVDVGDIIIDISFRCYRVTGINRETLSITSVDYPIKNSVLTCSTAAATADKTVASEFSYLEGDTVTVKFTNSVPANSTINFTQNNYGAKPIYYKGSAITSGVISGGEVVTLMCVNDGSGIYFEIVSIVGGQSISNQYVSKSGDTMSGNLNMGGNQITNVSSIDMNSHKIVNLTTPTANTDAANKKYVDDSIASAISNAIAGSY